MEFKRTERCKLVKHELQTGVIEGKEWNWFECDFLMLDEPGVIRTTIGTKALNGATLEDGKDYEVTFIPKARAHNGRPFVADDPKVAGIRISK